MKRIFALVMFLMALFVVPSFALDNTLERVDYNKNGAHSRAERDARYAEETSLPSQQKSPVPAIPVPAIIVAVAVVVAAGFVVFHKDKNNEVQQHHQGGVA